MIDLRHIVQKKSHQILADYSIQVCTPSGIGGVRAFLKEYWRKDHPFVIHKELLDWQYYNKGSECYNIMVATHKGSGEIHGVYAFIPVSQFDLTLAQYRDVWLSIWKVRPDVKTPLLGISLLSYLIDTLEPRALIGVLSSPIAKALYASNSDFRTGMLNHYYMLNREKRHFTLVGNFDGTCSSGAEADESKEIEELDATDWQRPSFNSLFDVNRVPTKSAEYVKNRFLNHPTYKYNLYKIVDRGTPVAVLVTRIQTYENSRAIRLVDYFGDEKALEGLSGNLQRLVAAADTEYIDFYNHGFSEQVMSNAGFLKRDASSGIIVPNYFNPFEKKNVDMDYLFKSEADDVVICKADADQDRPNDIP